MYFLYEVFIDCYLFVLNEFEQDAFANQKTTVHVHIKACYFMRP